MDKEYKIAFLAKGEKPGVNEALKFLYKTGFSVTKFIGALGDPFPVQLNIEKFDIIVSYISPWIVPVKVLSQTKLWNVNFHPGPPEYPGTGCFNFAIYNNESRYGCTAHFMAQKVDTGEIISVDRFDMSENETVESLSIKTYYSMLELFQHIFKYLLNNSNLPNCKEKWSRVPYRRSELEELSKIEETMEEDEINLRIRSTYYPGKPAPYIDIKGHRFEYNPKR